MNGPEHYRKAEEHVRYAVECGATDSRGEKVHLMYAQVHATLAHAAAVATMDATEGPNGGSATGRLSDDANAWAGALGAASD